MLHSDYGPRAQINRDQQSHHLTEQSLQLLIVKNETPQKNTSDEIEGLIDYDESNPAIYAYKKTARKANSDLTFAKFKNDRTGFIHPKLASIVELSALLDFVPQNLFMEDPST